MTPRWCGSCSAASSASEAGLRGRVRARRARSAAAARGVSTRRHHARHPDAADGRPRMPRPHHGREAVPGGHGVVADGGRRRGDARGPASRGRRLRAEARRGGLAAHRRICAARWCEKIRAAATAKIKDQRAASRARAAPHAATEAVRPAARGKRRDGARLRRRPGAGRHLDRRSARARSVAGPVARELSVADRRRAAHAGDLHGTARQAAGRAVRAPRRRGRAPDCS